MATTSNANAGTLVFALNQVYVDASFIGQPIAAVANHYSSDLGIDVSRISGYLMIQNGAATPVSGSDTYKEGMEIRALMSQSQKG